MVLLLSVASAARAAPGRWSLSPALGLAHQDFTSTGLLVSLDVAVGVASTLDLGARGGYFDPGGCCSSEPTDTHYGLLFARWHRAREAWQPFIEAGGGEYVVQNDTEPGWFMGAGLDRRLSERTNLYLAARYHTVSRPASGISPDFGELQVGFRFRL